MANVKKRGRGRPRKIDIHQNVKVDVKLVKMKDVEFDDRLFVPMKTKTIVDSVLSNEGGIFPGTNTVICGDPGVGKSTVLLDWVAGIQKQGKRVLFISGEMNEIDMYGYTKRFPSFANIPIMFLSDYSKRPKEAVEQVIKDGYDVVLIDSWAEVISMVQDQTGMQRKSCDSWLLDLMDKANKGQNTHNCYTAFVCIQQMTKAGEFAGSNRIKHMTTAMAFLKFDSSDRDAERYLVFEKNRRGNVGDKIYFSLARGGRVDYNFDEID
jgi:DNA repair protein RadA/Sms